MIYRGYSKTWNRQKEIEYSYLKPGSNEVWYAEM
jgi:hypothetical protein